MVKKEKMIQISEAALLKLVKQRDAALDLLKKMGVKIPQNKTINTN